MINWLISNNNSQYLLFDEILSNLHLTCPLYVVVSTLKMKFATLTNIKQNLHQLLVITLNISPKMYSLLWNKRITSRYFHSK